MAELNVVLNTIKADLRLRIWHSSSSALSLSQLETQGMLLPPYKGHIDQSTGPWTGLPVQVQQS